MMHWFVFQSKTRKEDLLYEQLRMRQIETFFPCFHVRPANPRSRKIRPYFPGYVFGRVDLDAVGRSILAWIPGTVGIVSFGGDPAPVPDHLVSALREHLDLINAPRSRALAPYQPGDVVSIHAGPFSGYEAIFNVHLPGRDRAEVLLKIIQGYPVRVELPLHLIGLKERPARLARL